MMKLPLQGQELGGGEWGPGLPVGLGFPQGGIDLVWREREGGKGGGKEGEKEGERG